MARNAYDAENRLIAVDGGSTASYIYGPEGRRVHEDVEGVVKEFVYGTGGQQLTVVDGSGNLEQAETYIGGRYLGTGEPSAFVWALSDELGTVRVRTNSSGAAVETDTSWPFGAYLSQVGTYSNLHFTGKYRDGETGLDYFGARFYNAALGRFLTPDWGDSPEAVPYADLSNPQSLNLYAYVQNNPVTDADTDGHCWPWCTALAGAAIGAVVGGVTEYPHEAIAHHTLDTWNGDKILHAAAGGAVAGTAIGVAGPAGGEALALGETSAAALATGGPLSVMLQGGRWSAASTEKRSPTAPRLRSTPGRA